MRLITTLLAALILLSLGAVPSMAQDYDGYGDGYEEGYTCWMCPVCGFVVQLDVPVDESATEYQTTLGQVMVINPYDLSNYCPYCGTYGAYFVLVPCSDYDEDGEEDENGEYYEDECEEEYFDDDEGDDDEVEEVEECEETEYVETGDEGEEETAGSGDNETKAAAEPVTSDEETANVTAQTPIETHFEEAGKILIVVPSKDYNDVEFNTTKSIFLDEGFEVVVASKGTEEAVGMDGSSVVVDLAVADAEVSDYEAVVFIGGPGVDDLELYEDPDYLDLASSAQYLDLVVAAICVAPKILANANLLDGKNATVFPDSQSVAYIKAKGAIYSQEQLVRDGKIITTSRPEASEAFAEAVVAAVKEGLV